MDLIKLSSKQMDINGYKVPESLIMSYLRSCQYNQSTGSEASDRMQANLYHEIFEIAGLNRAGVTREDRKFIRTLDDLVDDLLRKGY